jgi:ATP-binding cassette, subfamily C (CFTR/MRP), member 4
MLSPLLLGYLISYFTTNSLDIDEQQAYLIATGLSLSLIITVLVFHPAQLYYAQSSLKMKIACCSLICKKVHFIHLLPTLRF